MANPVVVSLPKDVWTIVALAKTSGQVHIMSSKPNVYFQTYRVTGDPAPTDLSDAVAMRSLSETISAATAIDVYIQPSKHAGVVRVDL